MAAHITTEERSTFTFTPDHELVYGVCGWWGRELTLSEQIELSETGNLGELETRLFGDRPLVVTSYCQYQSEGGTILVTTSEPEITGTIVTEELPPPGE